ncbi:unnamed protein product [Rotaria sp. Silwood1]|nr:unnamed protein product [Rotaria sp. Silwood1]CAF5006502.1 unnamed protein product [Rotaria sp. Silwood1]
MFLEAMSNKYYHGDPDRNNHFWVYPKNKELITPRWDTYKASDLCDNCTYLDKDSESEIETYQCNGHDNAAGSGVTQAQIPKRRRG